MALFNVRESSGRRLARLALAGALLLAPAGLSAAQRVAETDGWRYYKGRSTPPLQGAEDWTRAEYDDSGWGPASPAPFGFADGDDSTVFADMQGDYGSVFLRRTFVIADGAELAGITRLTLVLDVDDGGVAYVNGAEVARINMPAGAVDHATTALSAREASRGDGPSVPQERTWVALDPALLRVGVNVLALSGHNVAVSDADFTLSAELYTGVNLVRGPFLQMPEPRRLTVVWRTDTLSDGVVAYGPDASCAAGTVVEPGPPGRQHAVILPEFPAGSGMFYRIRSDGEDLGPARPLVAPKGPGQPFRAVILGDFGVVGGPMTAMAARVDAEQPDLFMTTGDNIYYFGQPGSFDSLWFTPFAPVMSRAPTLPAYGNHDSYSEDGRWYRENLVLPQNGPAGLKEKNYSFDYGNAHFIVLDGNSFDAGNAAEMTAITAWAAADLSSSTSTWKIATLHQPGRTSFFGHDESPNVRDLLYPVLEQNGVHAVFCGHNHLYERINHIRGVFHCITGAGGQGLYTTGTRRDFSRVLNNTDFSFTRLDFDGPRMTLTQINLAGAVIDTFDQDLSHPFRVDGLLDDPAWLRASNGLNLYAAIRGNRLYLATQDAGEGSDHFIYLAAPAAPPGHANWAKAGQVAGWSAFLADENDGGFHGWFDAAQTPMTDTSVCRSMTSGLNDNAPAGNGVLEGTLDLVAHLGAFPQQIRIAAAPFSSPDGGALVPAAQVPAGNGNGDVEAGEFLVLNTRDIALDPPVSHAGVDQTVEAGMTVGLAGAEDVPGGLPTTVLWTQTAGTPAVALRNATTVNADFAADANVTEPARLTFRLRVNDSRFDADDEVDVVLTPMTDSDGDGLSDAEEQLGRDNALTPVVSPGRPTRPDLSDTDGDGMSDGQEALAGTDANDPLSWLRITTFSPGAVRSISWSSVPGKTYRVQFKDRLSDPDWQNLAPDVPATGPTCGRDDDSPLPAGGRMYRVVLVTP